MTDLQGMICALCTPMSDDGAQVDENALKAHLDRILAAGSHGVLVCGGTGEFAMLRAEERKRIVEVAVSHVGGRVPLIAHVSATNTEEAVAFAEHAEGTGADVLLLLPPYFEGPDAEGVYRHFERVAEAVSLPIMVYNIPVHSGFDVTPAFFKRLREIDKVRYIKDSTGDILRIQDLLETGAAVFNGGDPISFYALLAGCPGCVLGGANAMPEQAVRLYELVKGGELAEARDLWERMLPANRYFWNPIYNARVKAAANLVGSALGPCRPPVMPLTQQERSELDIAMRPLLATAAR